MVSCVHFDDTTGNYLVSGHVIDKAIVNFIKISCYWRAFKMRDTGRRASLPCAHVVCRVDVMHIMLQTLS